MNGLKTIRTWGHYFWGKRDLVEPVRGVDAFGGMFDVDLVDEFPKDFLALIMGQSFTPDVLKIVGQGQSFFREAFNAFGFAQARFHFRQFLTDADRKTHV